MFISKYTYVLSLFFHFSLLLLYYCCSSSAEFWRASWLLLVLKFETSEITLQFLYFYFLLSLQLQWEPVESKF